MVRLFLNNQIFANLCNIRDEAEEKYKKAKRDCEEIKGYEAKLDAAIKETKEKYDESKMKFAEIYITQITLHDSMKKAIIESADVIMAEKDMLNMKNEYDILKEQRNKLKPLRENFLKCEKERDEARKNLGVFLRKYTAELITTKNELREKLERISKQYEKEYGHWYYMPHKGSKYYMCLWCHDEIDCAIGANYIDISKWLNDKLSPYESLMALPEASWPEGLKDAVDKVCGLSREIIEINELLAQVY